MEALRLRKASHPLPPMDDVAQYEHFVEILGWSEHCFRWKLFTVFRPNLDIWWWWITSDPKILSQFLEPNAMCTKFGVALCRIAPLSLTKNQDFSWNYFNHVFAFQYLGLTSPREPMHLSFHFITYTSSCVTRLYIILLYVVVQLEGLVCRLRNEDWLNPPSSQFTMKKRNPSKNFFSIISNYKWFFCLQSKFY